MKKNDQPTKRVFNLIIVDESGSMSIIRRQAFSGINETLQTVRNMQEQFPGQEQRVTLVTFDSFNTAWHYDNTPARQTKDLAWTDYSPSGGTPLYDAMGMAISKLNAQTSDADNVLVTVITDGEENSSKEWTLKMVRTMIEKLKQHNWTFTLIGTDNLDVEGMAHSMSIDEHLQFTEDAESTRRMFLRERKARVNYNAYIQSDCARPVGRFFDDED